MTNEEEKVEQDSQEEGKEKVRRKQATAAYSKAVFDEGQITGQDIEEEIKEALEPEAALLEDEESEEAVSAEPQDELEQALQKAAEYFDGWQRERADFANYKKRIQRDQQHLSQVITGDVIKKYLVVMDDLERALKAQPTKDEAATWAEGIELIYRKLQNILESERIEVVPAENQEFDPTIHEAISHEDSNDHKNGQIIEVVQQGYKLGDRVLRPALVRVAR